MRSHSDLLFLLLVLLYLHKRRCFVYAISTNYFAYFRKFLLYVFIITGFPVFCIELSAFFLDKSALWLDLISVLCYTSGK